MHLHSKKWLKPWGYTTYLAKYAFALKKVAKTMGYSQVPNNRSSGITIAKGNFGKTAIIYYPNNYSMSKNS